MEGECPPSDRGLSIHGPLRLVLKRKLSIHPLCLISGFHDGSTSNPPRVDVAHGIAVPLFVSAPPSVGHMLVAVFFTELI
jgi:hypothetical protein